MAGIGEASAILAVAQIGISLSNTLITYFGEVQDAPIRIQHIGNEVLITSERLKDIGELVDKNHQTRIFSDEGVLSAARCSEECKKILLELKNVLGKSGWHQQWKVEDKIEIDSSLFSTLRRPFLRTKLEVPRAELNRIKIDLMLLFSSAMALRASSAVEKTKFRQAIPRLSRTRDWAARKAEQARRQALDRERDPQRRTTAKDEDWIEGEPEIWQEFADFQERRMREENDQRLDERAALLLVQRKEQKRKAEVERRVLEMQVRDRHKREQDENQARTATLKAGLRDQLTGAGLGPDQIDSILESSIPGYTEMAYESFMPIIRPATASGKASNASVKVEGRKGPPSTTSRTYYKWRSKLPWRHFGKRRPDAYSFDSGNESTSIESSSGPAYHGFLGGPFLAEAWLIDVYANERAMLWPSDEWYTAKWKKALAKRQTKRDVWHEFAQLKPLWRTAILQFLSFKNEDKATRWSLLSIEIPQRPPRTRLLGHKSDDQVVQVILLSRKNIAGDDNTSKDPPKPLTIDDLPHRPVQTSNASAIRGQAGDSANIHGGNEIRGKNRKPRVERSAAESDARWDAFLARNRDRVRKEPGNSQRTEEIVIPRDNTSKPIHAVSPYGQEVTIREAPPNPDRRSHRDGVPPPDRERPYNSESRRRGSQNDDWCPERPMPGSRRYEQEREADISRERLRSREMTDIKGKREEDVVVRRRSKSPERNYDDEGFITRRNSNSREKGYGRENIVIRRGSKSPEGSYGKDGTIFNRWDIDRPRNSNQIPPPRPPPHFSRDDYVPNEARKPRHEDSSHQQQQSVIQQPELERTKRYIVPPYIVPPYNGSGEIQREKPRQNLINDTSDDWTTIERPGAPSETPDQAVVRRPGGTRQVDGYMQDHVLDRSIRIRPFPPNARQYERWGRQQPIRRLLRSRMYSDSEDEDDVGINYAEKQASSEPMLTDEQLIARTLEKFTNLKTETNPISSIVIPTSVESVALPSVIAEATTKTVTMSDEAGDSAPQAGLKRSGEGADSDESQRPSFDEVTDNGIRIAPDQATGVIVEEPAVMTDKDGPTQDVRSDMAKRRARFADEAESSGNARKGNISDPERDSDGDLRHEETDGRKTKATRKRLEARRMLREADEMSDEYKEISRKSTTRRTPNSRSATVEDTILELEDGNGNRMTVVERARESPILNTQRDAQSEVSSDVYDD